MYVYIYIYIHILDQRPGYDFSCATRSRGTEVAHASKAGEFSVPGLPDAQSAY